MRNPSTHWFHIPCKHKREVTATVMMQGCWTYITEYEPNDGLIPIIINYYTHAYLISNIIFFHSCNMRQSRVWLAIKTQSCILPQRINTHIHNYTFTIVHNATGLCIERLNLIHINSRVFCIASQWPILHQDPNTISNSLIKEYKTRAL